MNPPPSIQLSRFLRRIESYHCRTPNRTAVPLHFDYRTQDLIEFPWPCDHESGERVPPSMLEDHQATHQFLAPCCLCAFLDTKEYVESSIGIIQEAGPDYGGNTSFLNGQYVALCAKRRCGYILCFERFYPNYGIKLQCYPKRLNPLSPKEVNILPGFGSLRGPCDEALLPMVPIFKGLPRAVRRRMPVARKTMKKPYEPDGTASERLRRKLMFGMPMRVFAETFVQCAVCKAVNLREGMHPYHECAVDAYRPLTPPGIHHDLSIVRENGRVVQVRVTTREGRMHHTYTLNPDASDSATSSSSSSEVVPDSQPPSPNPDPED